MIILKEKGQTTVEYLLLFTVTLFIAGGLLFQFNDAFKNFVNGYFGAYLSCLLESGELPSLGWDGGSGQDDTCEGEFEPFNLASGRQPILAGFDPKSKMDPIVIDSKPGANPKFADGSGGGKGKGAATGPNAEMAAAGSSRGVPVGGSSRPFETIGDREKRENGGRVPLTKGEEKDAKASNALTGGDVVANVNRSKKDSLRAPYVPLVGFEEEGAEKKKKTSIPATEEDIAREVNRIPAEELKKKKSQIDEDPSLTFSDFIKYILIFAIIVAMVLFLGGQAVQISKSQEK